MLEYYEMLLDQFNFTAPHAVSMRARVSRRNLVGIWIGRMQRLYVAAARPLLLSSEYDGTTLITRSTLKPFVWVTAERQLVIADGNRRVITELEALLQQALTDDERRWIDMGLRQDVGAMTGVCARLRQTSTEESLSS